MLYRWIYSVVLSLMIVLISGCSFLKSWASPPTGYVDGTEVSSEPWTSEAGRTGRGHRDREKDPDSWWGKWFMSSKARDIERNMGIDHN